MTCFCWWRRMDCSRYDMHAVILPYWSPSIGSMKRRLAIHWLMNSILIFNVLFVVGYKISLFLKVQKYNKAVNIVKVALPPCARLAYVNWLEMSRPRLRTRTSEIVDWLANDRLLGIWTLRRSVHGWIRLLGRRRFLGGDCVCNQRTFFWRVDLTRSFVCKIYTIFS
jgi:hypothetical protein